MALAFDVKEIRKQRNPSNPHTLARDGNIVKLASCNFIKRYTVKLKNNIGKGWIKFYLFD